DILIMSPTSDEIDRLILKYIEDSDWPVTTEMVAKGAGVSWNTAQIHLYKLQSEGKIKGKRVGRQNQWMRIRS
ncbi:MAG: FaeA/PapI family transcriptional regulator, partial [Nitrosotalea sp.]